ncbi:hypothetical protein GCM10009608_80960 [Pseudonocardia alaniniphila]
MFPERRGRIRDNARTDRGTRGTFRSSGGHTMIDEFNPDEHRSLVDSWLREYVSVGDRRIGRSGPVCPFVPRALNEHALETHIRYDIDGSDEPELIDALQTEIREFGAAGHQPRSSGVLLDSWLIVMPRMGPDGWERLDAAYERLKDFAVQSGLMVGQFHPNCDERAFRNSGFRVSIAPVALLAIRHMAPHDVLFLHDSERWFRVYHSRFHTYFERGRVRDPLLLSLYRRARDRHGLSA